MRAAWIVDVYQPTAARFAAPLPIVQLLFYGPSRAEALLAYQQHLPRCVPIHAGVLEGAIDGKAAFATGQYRTGEAIEAAPSPIGVPTERELVRLVIDSRDPTGLVFLSHVFFVPRDEQATVAAWNAMREHQRNCGWLQGLSGTVSQPESGSAATAVRWYDGGWLERC